MKKSHFELYKKKKKKIFLLDYLLTYIWAQFSQHHITLKWSPGDKIALRLWSKKAAKERTSITVNSTFFFFSIFPIIPHRRRNRRRVRLSPIHPRHFGNLQNCSFETLTGLIFNRQQLISFTYKDSVYGWFFQRSLKICIQQQINSFTRGHSSTFLNTPKFRELLRLVLLKEAHWSTLLWEGRCSMKCCTS